MRCSRAIVGDCLFVAITGKKKQLRRTVAGVRSGIEAAAKPGNDVRATTYGSIKSILEKGLGLWASPTTDTRRSQPANIHGPDRSTDQMRDRAPRNVCPPHSQA
jgi:hypothetical protein